MGDRIEERVLIDSWDWPTRVLHWVNAGLVVALILIMLGAEYMEGLGVERSLRRPVKELHSWLGHIFVITFSLRLIWAFIGNRYARWSDMIPFRREQRDGIARDVKWYLSGFKGGAARVAGHDPLAALFYLAVFIVLVSQAVTGLLLSGVEFGSFPGSLFTAGLGEEAAEELEHGLEEVHEAGYFLVLFFIAAHLAGLVVHEIKEKTGLLTSMINGKKYLPKE